MTKEVISKIQLNQLYQDISEPINDDLDMNTVMDAEFLVRKDGTIFNVEGYAHPTNSVVCEALYAPDDKNTTLLWGEPYKKVTLFDRTYEPIPYPQRAEILARIDPAFGQNRANPYFAKYKQILPTSDFIAHLPSRKAIELALSRSGLEGDKFLRDFENLIMLLGISPNEVALGLTGSLLLGYTETYHDLDIVFTGTLEQNLIIAKKMRDLALIEPHRRLFEGGKGWQIRFFNDYGSLMCTFFTYPDKKLAPLNKFTMEVIEDHVEITGTVSDDQHTIYTPSIFSLSDALIKNSRYLTGKQDAVPVVVYHTATRGDCFNQDAIRAKGALVVIDQEGMDPYTAVCVVDREGVENLTPPWRPYYT